MKYKMYIINDRTAVKSDLMSDFILRTNANVQRNNDNSYTVSFPTDKGTVFLNCNFDHFIDSGLNSLIYVNIIAIDTENKKSTGTKLIDTFYYLSSQSISTIVLDVELTDGITQHLNKNYGCFNIDKSINLYDFITHFHLNYRTTVEAFDSGLLVHFMMHVNDNKVIIVRLSKLQGIGNDNKIKTCSINEFYEDELKRINSIIDTEQIIDIGQINLISIKNSITTDYNENNNISGVDTNIDSVKFFFPVE